MSNLGWYQKIVEYSSKVGGPKNLLCLTLLGGAVIGAGTYAGGETVIKKFKTVHVAKTITTVKKHKSYIVTTSGESNEGIKFERGDLIQVLAKDSDAVLIEKTGDDNSPYFISEELLNTLTKQVEQ